MGERSEAREGTALAGRRLPMSYEEYPGSLLEPLLALAEVAPSALRAALEGRRAGEPGAGS